MATVAVFGGSFNPPHVAHVLAATYVLATCPVDEVLIVPAFEHPFGKPLAPFEHRVAMCERAFGDVRRVAVSTIERDMGGAARTLFLLRALRERHPDWQLRLVVGSDILNERHKWYAWDEVVALAPPIVLGRVGHPAEGAPLPVLPEVASRDVRARLARGEDVSPLVPRGALAYAAEHGLYQGEGA